MTEVLRGEWAFRGVAISDFNLYGYMPADQGLRAGTNMQLTFSKAFADTESATSRQAMRTAYKNMCYTVANSNLMQGVAPGATIVYSLAGGRSPSSSTMSSWSCWPSPAPYSSSSI